MLDIDIDRYIVVCCCMSAWANNINQIEVSKESDHIKKWTGVQK